jgi:dolichol-phosphate mannosyltransferase
MDNLISYVFPIYNEEGNIDLLLNTIKKVTKSLENKYSLEFVFINDGSKDNSLRVLREIQKKDSRVKIIDFSKNFGHQIAVTAGIDYAKGDAVIIMDSDMQDPPNVSLELIKKWEEGYEVVYAQRRTRKDFFLKKLTAKIFYRVLNLLSDVDIPKDTGDFRLIDRKVVEVLKDCKEHNRFLRGLISSIGFKQTGVLFDRDERHAGKTGYSLKKMIQLAKNGMLGFSSAPIKLIYLLSLIFGAFSIISLLLILFFAIFKVQSCLTQGTFVLIIILSFFSSLQLFAMGLLGDYIFRIYKEAQNRPLYVISKIYE